MAWSVDDIYNLVKFLTRKNQAGGISAKDLFYAWNTEQNAYHSDLLGKWQNRNNGKTGANTGLVMNETIMTELSPFVIKGQITLSSGRATKPEDFIYGLARRILVGGEEYKVDKINHGQKSYVNEDVIDPPSISDGTYYVIEYENHYEFLPTTSTGQLQLDYVASCNDIVWGFTFDTKDRQVYNSGTSVQPKWNTPTIIDITKRTLVSFGVSFHDKDFQNFGKSNIQTGDS